MSENTSLRCAVCRNGTPLNPPRYICEEWCAMCPGCLTEFPVEPATHHLLSPSTVRFAQPLSRAESLGPLLCREQRSD